MKSDQEIEHIPAELISSETNLNNWLSSGFDIFTRTLHIVGDVDEAMLIAVQRSIIALNTINHDPIRVYLTTHGGSMEEGFAIYDTLRSSTSPIIMIASGLIASIGIVIFLGGTERYGTPNTRFMIHAMSSSIPPGDIKLKDQIIDINEAKNANDMMMNIIADRTKLSKKTMRSNTFNHDYYFGVEEAEQFGITTKHKSKRGKREKTEE